METKTFDVSFINPFIAGTIETLKTQCSMDVTAGKPFLNGQGPKINADIAAIIGLVAKTFNGSVSLLFQKTLFLALMEQMLGENHVSINEEIEDGASELLNIIFGQAKKHLNENGYQLEKAIPTVVRGPNITIKHISHGVIVVVPFETRAGQLHLEIARE